MAHLPPRADAGAARKPVEPHTQHKNRKSHNGSSHDGQAEGVGERGRGEYLPRRSPLPTHTVLGREPRKRQRKTEKK